MTRPPPRPSVPAQSQPPGIWERLGIWRASPRTVMVSLLVGMLLVVGVTGGSMLFFSTLVVQRQISRLPPELRDQFRDQDDPGRSVPPAARSSGEAPYSVAPYSAAPCSVPCPTSAVGTSDTALPALVGPVLVGPGLVAPVLPAEQIRRGGSPLNGRAHTFLRDVAESLRAASLVSAIFGLLLAAVLARRIARPISAVSEAAVLVAAGDLSARARLLPGDRETTELARSFNVMAQGLQALEQERQNTVASIAHELRTPLTVIQARLDAIEDGIYPLDQQQVLQLSTQTQLLTRLVADLRTLSLAGAGRLTLQPAQVRPLWLAQSVAQDIRAARAGSSVRVEVQGHETTLRADPDRLRQVLINLTENAFKHARSRVLLTVQPNPVAMNPVPTNPVQPNPVQALGTTDRPDTDSGRWRAGLCLHIDDDGPGIPEQERDRVFENFVRLETSRSRDSGGTGLGLAVVRALMLAHGGQVELGHSPLGGTRATLRFPAAQVFPD